jgi:hypothetical protein
MGKRHSACECAALLRLVQPRRLDARTPDTSLHAPKQLWSPTWTLRITVLVAPSVWLLKPPGVWAI